MIQQQSLLPFRPQELLQPQPLLPRSAKRMMIQRIELQELFPRLRPQPLLQPQLLLHPQSLSHPHPLSQPHPQFVAAKSLIILFPPKIIYTPSYESREKSVREKYKKNIDNGENDVQIIGYVRNITLFK